MFAILLSQNTLLVNNGATILVKLWQFDPEDRHQMSVDTLNTESQPVTGRDGASEIALYSDDRENVRVEIWEAGSQQFIKGHKGLEVFVISGGFSESGEQFEMPLNPSQTSIEDAFLITHDSLKTDVLSQL